MAKKRKKSIPIGIGLLKLVFLAMLVFGVFAVSNMLIVRQAKLNEMEANEAKIQKLSQEVESISKEIEKSDSPEFVEKIARDELGMIKPREVIFIDKNKEREEKEADRNLIDQEESR